MVKYTYLLIMKKCSRSKAKCIGPMGTPVSPAGSTQCVVNTADGTTLATDSDLCKSQLDLKLRLPKLKRSTSIRVRKSQKKRLQDTEGDHGYLGPALVSNINYTAKIPINLNENTKTPDSLATKRWLYENIDNSYHSNRLISSYVNSDGCYSNKYSDGYYSNTSSDLHTENKTETTDINNTPSRSERYNVFVNKLNLHSTQPFFSKWKIAGFKNNQVILRSLTNMNSDKTTAEQTAVTPEFVQYIKERDAALEEVKVVQTELREANCKLYDAMKVIEELETKLKKNNTKKAPPAKKKTVTPAPSNLKTPSKASVAPSSASGTPTKVITGSVRTDGSKHPSVEGIDDTADTLEYYWKLAEMFQSLPMFHILEAEKKFANADKDGNGAIDKEELNTVLTDTIDMFTDTQLDEIFKIVDCNNSNTLDFKEVLTVLSKLYSRRKINLPLSIQQNYSKTCVLQ